MVGFSRRRGDRTKNLVGFTIADVNYAVEILRVREIINPLEIVNMPHLPSSILGVADYRGDIVPVIDIRQRFHLSSAEATRRTKWLIAALEDRLVALVVDRVTEVFGTSDEEQRKSPSMGRGAGTPDWIAAVYAHQGRLVFIVDIDKVSEVAQELDLGMMRGLIKGSSRG